MKIRLLGMRPDGNPIDLLIDSPVRLESHDVFVVDDVPYGITRPKYSADSGELLLTVLLADAATVFGVPNENLL